MATIKTGQNIVDEFDLLTDEQADMSTAEKLALAQQVIDIILNDRDWTFLVKSATGTLDATNTEYSLPTDFRQLAENYDNDGTPERILFVDTTFERYHWIDMAQRRDVRDSNGYAYIDYRQDNFVLTKVEQTSRSYEFDYIYNPADITLSTSPVIPTHFQSAIPKFMAVLWADIDQTDKSFSYALENNREYQDYINEMRVQDAQHANQYQV